MDKYAKKNISTEQSAPGEKARVSGPDEHTRRPQRNQTPPGEGPQKTDRSPLLRFSLPKENRLRKRADFQRVYNRGRRIEGRFMTAFILPSETSFHRLGVTATKKAVGNAVKRNRAKRLLRETFRLCKAELGGLRGNFDWVLNARRELVAVKLDGPVDEFKRIIAKIFEFESAANKDVDRGVD